MREMGEIPGDENIRKSDKDRIPKVNLLAEF